MEYNFRDIEKKWQKQWKESNAYKVENDFSKPKYYVLDMFPYPSGAGLHVGHPLGYIASDIYSRYKRLKGFNVLHPMGFDSFGLPAEQYALETGQHPAETTKKNIETYKAQLNNIGFGYDWSREVQTSDPKYYKWTQWIFLQLFNSYFCHTEKKALPISLLIKKYETKGAMPKTGEPIPGKHFTAEQWNAFTEKEQADILMKRRLAFCGYGEVNWCEALGTVLANDEVVNGVSERGGHPVVKKTLRQWYLRITDYADRLLEGLNTVDFSDAMKEMQSNWIGKSSGAEIDFVIRGSASPQPSPHGEGAEQDPAIEKFFKTADTSIWQTLKEYGRENRKNPTEAEDILWQRLRNNQLGAKVRRQHTIQGYIVDFAFLEVKLVIEVDGEYHNEAEQKIYDEARTKFLNQFGLQLLRFTNEQVIKNTESVIKEIKSFIEQQRNKIKEPITNGDTFPSLQGEGWGEAELKLRVYTTRPDTIFGVDFMVIAPELDLVNEIKSSAQATAVDEYLAYVKSRSERERMAEKKISGVFTGAYAVNPFSGREIPIWISEYVLAGYGTGAIMAVPCGDERDLKFAKHFNIPVTNIIGSYYNGEEANPTKEAILENSGFLDGLVMKEAMEVTIKALEDNGIGKRKVNYKMRDAAFSRQRYWGEPFPIVWKNGIAYPLNESELPLELPHVDSYKPGPDGQGPLANITEWVLIPSPPAPLHGVERGEAGVPKYSVYTPVQYELAKQMRKEYTEAEGLLWELLRGNKVGVKFRRQHPIDKYIVDFICLQERIIVEADGGYHATEEQKFYDAERTRVLNDIGFEVIRFTNQEITEHPYKVKDKIKARIEQKKAESSDNSPLHEVEKGSGVRETNTMPGYAGSSWYFLRYMDNNNDKEFCSRSASDYWNQVDLYIGGTEHAVGHLLYSRMWTKVLYDLNLIGFDEPYKRLVNQGMILGVSEMIKELRIGRDISGTYSGFAKRVLFHIDKIDVTINVAENINSHIYISKDVDFDFELSVLEKNGNLLQVEKEISEHHAKISFIDQGSEKSVLNIEKWMSIEPVYKGSVLICKNGYWQNGRYNNFTGEPSSNKIEFLTQSLVEKMSKSKLNTENPDDIVNKYGADTFRMYEMFLGPVEMSKPWDTKGIEGVHRFLKKFWRLFADEIKGLIVTDDEPTAEELKVLHHTIKKIESDTERFSFNTGVSGFMIATNELTDLKCHKRKILEPLLILLVPYAPHIAEELWSLLGNSGSILNASYPVFEGKYVVESSKEYPISVNGKLRTTMNISLDAAQPEVEKLVLENEVVKKWLEGKPPKKIIFVQNKMVNIVV